MPGSNWSGARGAAAARGGARAPARPLPSCTWRAPARGQGAGAGAGGAGAPSSLPRGRRCPRAGRLCQGPAQRPPRARRPLPTLGRRQGPFTLRPPAQCRGRTKCTVRCLKAIPAPRPGTGKRARPGRVPPAVLQSWAVGPPGTKRDDGCGVVLGRAAVARPGARWQSWFFSFNGWEDNPNSGASNSSPGTRGHGARAASAAPAPAALAAARPHASTPASNTTSSVCWAMDSSSSVGMTRTWGVGVGMGWGQGGDAGRQGTAAPTRVAHGPSAGPPPPPAHAPRPRP
jgi:hypothetical protein